MPYYKWIAAAAFLLMAGACSAQVGSGGGTGPLTCTATNGSVTPTIRAEGLTELVGDIVIACNGGVAPAPGTTLPQVNITIFLNTAITSRLQDSTNGSEALLIIDEPGSGLQGSPATQLACATPLTGCTIVANGSTTPYDGSPGHPNIFPAIVQGNALTFYGVPFAATGSSNSARILRITNIRVNASGLATGGSPYTAVASISAPGATLPLSNPTLTVGFVTYGLVYDTHVFGPTSPVNSLNLSTCLAGQYCQAGYLQFQENFATAFKTRLLGAAQNIPGALNNSESGFYSPGLAASNPNLATAGLADFATRLKADFTGVPAGAQLWVGLNSISSTGATLTSNESGPFAAVAASGSISGIPAAQLTVTNGAASAVWEVTGVNPAQIDTAQFPVWVYFPPASTPSGTLTIKGSYAPNPDDGAFTAASAGAAQNSTYAVPRFASGNLSIRHLNPNTAIAGGASFSLTVSGAQFVSGSAVYWNGAPLTTTFVNSNQLTAFVPASLIAVEGSASVTVVNPGGLTAPVLTFTTFTAPEAVSVTPSASIGSAQTFAFAYSDKDGAGDLASVEALINGNQNGAGGCYVYVTPANGAVSLASDDGGNFPAPLLLGTTGTLQNSQCSINVGQSMGVASGNTYTLTLAITFQSGFTGIKNIYGDAQDWAGFDSGWQQLGTWSQTTEVSVSAVSVTPSSGSGSSQLFAFQFSDSAGAQDFLQTNILIGSSSAVPGACAVVFNRANGTLALLTDSGAPPSSTIPIGSGSQQNSQCTLMGSGSSVTTAGATLTLNVLIVFQPAFAGGKNIYASATSLDGSTATQQLGVWTTTAPNNTVPIALRFVPVTPCRVADTRNATGPFDGPAVAGGTTRDFVIPNSACGIPSTAKAYSLNVTVVPGGPLGFITVFPAGTTQPLASTLNSLDGRVKSNASIVPAGAGGAVSIFVSNATDIVLDINGYFVPATDPAALAFFPVTPCRVADTRQGAAPFGSSLVGGLSRTFPVLSSACNIPATAQAYSLNLTAVPPGPLGYVTAWPTGQAQPGSSSLNAPTGAVTANAAIIPAGTGGSIDIFASNPTDMVIDINGYFAPMATGGLSLYNVTPCRALDTRTPAGSPPFSGELDTVISGNCVPSGAQAYVVNATVVPPTALGFLTLWPQSQSQPTVSTLNALDSAITSNMAIVPTLSGSISAFASNPTHLILDIFGYFAP